MTKERFLELVNLYLDNEIEEQETEVLFEAIESNDEFRRIYDDYSRITVACSMLSPAQVEVRTRRNFSQIVYAVGGLAAAFALVGLAVRNLEPIFQNGEASSPAALAPVARQLNADQVLGPEQIQMASFASNWDTRSSSGYRFSPETSPVSERIENASWKEGLNLKLDSSDYSMSHELSLVLDEATKAELLSNAIDGSKKEDFLNYKYSRKEPVRLSISSDQEAVLPKTIRFDPVSLSASK